jgi:hypothetical protein
MLAVYGSAVLQGEPLDYAGWVGLYLNLGRIRLRQAQALTQALGAAQGNVDPTWEWADALATSPELVDEILYQMASARSEARAKAKIGWVDP